MKLITNRSLVLVVFILIFLLSLVAFTANFPRKASSWAMQPYNKHLYKDGILATDVQIFDRNGTILFNIENNISRYNSDVAIRKATMHAIGDLNGNIATSAQVAFSSKLAGWNLLNGVYRYGFSPTSELTLTIDADLCRTAYNALNGRKGTVGVYNYKTGEILCMVSSPTFDPENMPDIGKDPEKFEGVYINRLLSGSYTPGSIFKLATAAAAIDNIKDIDSRIFKCTGSLDLDEGRVTCPHPHGEISFKEALAKSCNLTFAEISLMLGRDTLQKYVDKLGFNSTITVNDIKTSPGKIFLKDLNDLNLAWAGIGQSKNMINPINFLSFMGAVANDGKRINPRILKKNTAVQGLTILSPENKRIMSESTAAELKTMMRYNVTEAYGDKNFRDLNLCAKTGTAEVSENGKPHAWFAGFMDREDCPLAFIVIVENSGSGIGIAAPVANKVLQAALKNR